MTIRQTLVPEHLLPALLPQPACPINGQRRHDARHDIDQLLADLRAAWAFATANHLAVLSINADRNGAYLIVAPCAQLRTLFGEDCSMVQRRTEHLLRTETWLGCIDHVRVFWKEVTCVH